SSPPRAPNLSSITMARVRKKKTAESWRSKVLDLVGSKEKGILAIANKMQIPICYLRCGLRSLMGEGRVATVADLVYFLLHAGPGAKDALMSATKRAGVDGDEAEPTVQLLMGDFGSKFQGGKDRSIGRPDIIVKGQGRAIGGLTYNFPKIEEKNGSARKEGAIFDQGGARRGIAYTNLLRKARRSMHCEQSTPHVVEQMEDGVLRPHVETTMDEGGEECPGEAHVSIEIDEACNDGQETPCTAEEGCMDDIEANNIG
ncbi:unnamed protein product, partial [Closterium sp. Naga37s-1]